MTARHALRIEPGTPGGYQFQGVLVFDDGTEHTVYADERARVIAKAAQAIEQYHAAKNIPIEELILDEFGEIVREPEQFSVAVRS